MPPKNRRPGEISRQISRGISGETLGTVPGGPWRSTANVAQWLSVASLAGLLVVVILVPSDSIAVEQGSALVLLPLAVLAWATAAVGERKRASRTDRLLDLLVWALAAWIGIAAIAVAGFGNLRSAVNEGWWWATAAATFTAARRVLGGRHASLACSVLLVALASGLAVQAAHQQWVTLPADRAQYEADPEQALQQSGIFAPPGSPERALFESRLYGGGPTATFALANSLAAVLLIGVVLASGMLVSSFCGGGVGTTFAHLGAKLLNPWRIGAAAGIAVLLCGVAMLWTESRSAFIGLAAAGGVAALYWICRSHSFRSTAIVAFAIGSLVLAVAVLWSLLRPGLLAGAPRSLRYRFEYWQATLDMVADHPWFGAGPGNFQERYVTYRLDQASESIADPHNWLMETLATGGVPALLLLVAAIVVGLRILVEQPQTHSSSAVPRWAMTSGAAFGFVGVLFAWISQAYLPNFDALVLSLMVAVGMAVALRPLTTLASPLEPLGQLGAGEGSAAIGPGLRWLAGAATVAVAVHLLAAGGWTVPGVAIPWLLVIAIALGAPAIQNAESPRAPTEAAQPRENGRRRAWVVGCGVALVAAWLWTAWLPKQRAAVHLQQGDFAVQSGRPGMAAEAYQRAAEADSWDPLPLVRQADVFRWAIVRQADSPTVRDRWANAWKGAIARNPAAGGLRLRRAAHRLHFFQRWGKRQDLVDARQDLLDAVARDRSNVEIAAQLAIVEAALENREAAQQWIARAETLAAAGDHADRQLTIVQVLPAEWIGERAETEPWRVTAAELLGSERLGSDL